MERQGSGGRRPRVMVVQPIHEAGMRVLRQAGCEAFVPAGVDVASLAAAARDVEGILVRTAPLPAAVIDAAPGLRVIARHGVGVDNIDVGAATRRGIPVAYTPGANTVSVAEHVLALMTAVAKRVAEYDASTRRGDWEVRNSYRAVDLDGKTLGIIGMGRIGSLVARKARAAFDMRVLGYDPLLDAGAIRKAGAEPASGLGEVLSASDVVTLHVPLTPETKGLLGAAELAQMKPGAILLNTSRGGVVDETALVAALADGRLLGAGLDVFAQEPPPTDHPLLKLSNVVVTPHSAALTVEGVMRMATGAAEAIVAVLQGRRPAHVVNPEVFGAAPHAGGAPA